MERGNERTGERGERSKEGNCFWEGEEEDTPSSHPRFLFDCEILLVCAPLTLPRL